jgi:hypothetical protein
MLNEHFRGSLTGTPTEWIMFSKRQKSRISLKKKPRCKTPTNLTVDGCSFQAQAFECLYCPHTSYCFPSYVIDSQEFVSMNPFRVWTWITGPNLRTWTWNAGNRSFLLWVPNLHGQFYLLFYALIIYFKVRGEGLHMMRSGLFFIHGSAYAWKGTFLSSSTKFKVLFPRLCTWYKYCTCMSWRVTFIVFTI